MVQYPEHEEDSGALLEMSANLLESPIVLPEEIAKNIRRHLVTMSHHSQAAHLGSALSCVDILVAAYWASGLKVGPEYSKELARDRVILSKGHAAAALYAVLSVKGFFSEKDLSTYGCYKTCLPEHPKMRCSPGVEVATGSLGHGLGLGIGMALAAKIQKRQSKSIVIMSDGECNEGSVWEAAMFAPAHRMDTVMAIIDFNKWQATGRSREVLSLDPLAEKWRAFGWDTIEVDGHDIDSLSAAISSLPNGSGKPMAVIAHTIKGKGVSFMEDDNNWHYRSPNDEELHAALEELRS